MIRKIIFLSFLSFLVSCNDTDEVTNIAPNVNFIVPEENLSVQIGDIINIEVFADDPDGQIDTVYIEFNGENIAQITSIPYSYEFNTSSLEAGNYELKAIASDNLGALSTSSIIIIEVLEFTIVPPTVQTLPPTNVGLFGANVTTTSTSFGTFGPVDRGICWSQEQNPVFDINTSNFQIADNTDDNGINNYDIDNLQPGETYYFRAFATYYDDLNFDSTAVSYGNNIEVTLSSEFYTETGSFTDQRDGEVYQWVIINGTKWMAENLRFADCEGYNDPDDTILYGKICSSCPDGWAIPTKDDYLQLFNYLGGTDKAGKYLKSDNPSFWNTPNNATNESLFSALPGGYTFAFDIEDPIEYEVGENGYYNYLYFNENFGFNVSGYVRFSDGSGVTLNDNEIGEPSRNTSARCVKIE